MVLSDSNRASVPMTPLIEEEQGPFQFMLENTRLFCAGNRKKQVSPCLPSLPHIYWTKRRHQPRQPRLDMLKRA